MLGLLVIAIQFHFTFLESKGRIKGGREGIRQFEGVTPADFDICVDVILMDLGAFRGSSTQRLRGFFTCF